MHSLRLHVQDTLCAGGGYSSSLLHEESNGVTLVQQPQLHREGTDGGSSMSSHMFTLISENFIPFLSKVLYPNVIFIWEFKFDC